MVEFARGPNGEYAVRRPGVGWQLVDEDTYRQHKMSRGQRLMGAFGDAIQDSAGFALDTIIGALSGGGSGSVPYKDLPGADIMAQNDPRQAARSAIDPTMATVGELGALGAEMLVPGAPAMRAARAPQRLAIEGIQSGARQGQDIVDNARALNAAVNPNPSNVSQERALRGMLTPNELDELSADFSAGKLYTPADEKALTARVGTDELSAADAARQTEELMRTDIVMDRAMGRGRSINGIRDEAADMITKVVMRELGENIATRATSANMRDIRARIGDDFEEVAKAAGDLNFNGRDVYKLDFATASAGADDAGIVGKIVEAIKTDIKNSVMPNKTAAQWRTTLNNGISNAANGGRFERAQSLGEVLDVLDDIVERQIPQDVAETLAEARYRYRIFKALERSTASTDAGGQVNIRSFMNAYQRRGNRFGRSVAKGEQGEQFYRTLETLRYLTDRVEPSSGTMQRLLANTAKGAGGAGMTGAGLTGAGLLLGD